MTRQELVELLLADESKLSETVVLKNDYYTGYLDVEGLETATVKKTTEEYRETTCDLYTDYFSREDDLDGSDDVEGDDVIVTVIDWRENDDN